MKRLIVSFVLCLCIVLTTPGIGTLADTKAVKGSVKDQFSVGEVGGYLAGNFKMASNMFTDRKFSINNPGYNAQHGFAAERVNNLIDKIHGKKAIVVGDDNLPNGPDRKIINRDGSVTWIQDKYCSSAKQSVEAAFDTESGLYRYISPDGTAMQLEVPKDQFAEAVEFMKTKIAEGKVPGVTNPEEASNLVRKGNLTYKQAVNLTKAGTIESLKYDAFNGTITATCAAGISFVMDYAVCRINGYPIKTALKEASLNGLKTGGVVFATVVISNQLMRTGVAQVFIPAGDAIARALGEKTSRAIVNALGKGAAGKTAEQVFSQASKILSHEMISSCVVVVILSAGDVLNLMRGRISKEQLLKNIGVTILGVGGGALGGLAGGAALGSVVPGAGTIIGGLVGGIAGGVGGSALGDWALSKLYAGDAEIMYEVISNQFQIMCDDYMTSEEDANAIIDKLQYELTGASLKDMFASDDREQFARELMEPLFLEQLSSKVMMDIHSEYEIRVAYKEALQGIVFIH